MAYKSGKCYACQRKRPVEGHHTFPRNYGGPDDGEIVDICADCHSIIHREAEVYYKTGKFQDIDSTIPYVKGGYGERLRVLIAKIVKAKQYFEAGLSQSGEQRRMTQVSWDSDEHLRIAHDVKKMMGFTSLPRAMKHLVFEKWHELQSGQPKSRRKP